MDSCSQNELMALAMSVGRDPIRGQVRLQSVQPLAVAARQEGTGAARIGILRSDLQGIYARSCGY